MKNKYLSTGIGLYVNYIVLGAASIILVQNTEFLADKWGVETSTVLWVISALGLGKILSIIISGFLSDKFGRKPFILLGIVSYILFFLGVLYSPTPGIAFGFTLLGGIANAFLDTGTYPALIEGFPERPGFATMLVGFAVSWGQFLFPLLLALLVFQGQWLGYSFIIPAVLIALNGFYMKSRKFPTQIPDQILDAEESSSEAKIGVLKGKAKKSDWIIFLLYAYFCQATSYIVVTWLAPYAADISGVSIASSRIIMSLYGAGAILCVPLTYKLQNRFRNDSSIALMYSVVSVMAVILLLLFPTPVMCALFAMLIGIACEGGVMQLVLTIMTQFFPECKGRCTGLYYALTGVATFSIPLMTGQLIQYGLNMIMLFDLFVAIIFMILSLMIYQRYKVVIENNRDIE
ncbi:MFS transporter [Alkalibaculum bacchi]|uniref:MFS transporter n=1 Tax=Alkalibaculum bacchi TaxID=645887 RepID=UPI0026F1B4CF|nr:MFS transporter [Alkalibaculum bacchi]